MGRGVKRRCVVHSGPVFPRGYGFKRTALFMPKCYFLSVFLGISEANVFILLALRKFERISWLLVLKGLKHRAIVEICEEE